MEILGIGPLEVLLILLIALILLGPRDMVEAGRKMGRFLRRIVTSSSWRTFQQASREFQNLPSKLIREAGLEEFEQDLKQLPKITPFDDLKDIDREIKSTGKDITSWISPPKDESANADISPWITPPGERRGVPESEQDQQETGKAETVSATKKVDR